MTVNKRDPLTGHHTTGHEWDGITELNTRVPLTIWWFILVSHLYALIAWVLLPAWPGITDYTKGILGVDQRQQVERQVAMMRELRADWRDQMVALPVDEIRANPALAAIIAGTGPALYGDNCAACHGPSGQGGPGYPSLVDEAWLWGGDPDAIMETLRVGINADHPETRFAQMPAFDGVLERNQIRTVALYVQSLSGIETNPDPDQLAAGKELFMDNCASCHGEDATGNTDLGAPNLTDDSWIYGGDSSSLFATILHGRAGWMPSWEARLDEADRKILTVYLMDLKDRESVQ
ncbi:cytochrome-c oxidase, cbb3-type subunit III [Pontibaca salina]|uniref:Cbb3-type cytochrome c oxidase subunit n=1 Tax=Pontibaca salina TaxID=2795731 RepID=A0A934HLP5_9RHOB|nr:cytochrome-c oxidase, cbb3-type subunit III [Pontibaca salina]MBI6630514.1 cytochrome-c oxidase, cbb3-type subunit III [Pontibaca salina]